MSEITKRGLILMAEDDSDDCLLAKDALAECGLQAELRFVKDGAELMDYLHHRNGFSDDNSPRPSMILLDLNMPRKDGREALREIKNDSELKRIPVVVFTTSRADTDIATTYALGASSFISKPVAFEALVNVMKSIRNYWFDIVLLPQK
ncbi:MAG: response regulator receiver protein [Pedosphaera sp.]|nr:response regulator receiver protein [Pedosphaera sp.]